MIHISNTKIPLEVDGEIIYIYVDQNSAEGKALQRIQTLNPDDSSQFTTLIEEGQPIHVKEGLQRLKKRGYTIQIPDSDCEFSQLNLN